MTKDIMKNLLIVFLVFTNLVSLYLLSIHIGQSDNLQSIVDQQKTNTKVVLFTQTLIEKVLKSTSPVDFETRLALENMVRNLNDKTILDKWNDFVNSSDSNQAQVEIKSLLDLLIKKINIIN